MKNLFGLVLLFAITLSASAQNLPAPVLLWPQGAPGATGATDEDKPAIIPVLPAEAKNTGAAIVVCPGGGFTLRAVDHEGVLVSRWLQDHGIAAFILRYRIRPMYERKDWLADARRALQHVRANAKQYRISPDRIGIMGFSAGANLAADAAFNPLGPNGESGDPLDRVSSRPDYLILSYGAAPMPATLPEAPPPTFMYCTAEDAGAMNGMVNLAAALHKAKIPVEAHLFAKGVHGIGFGQGDPILGEWPNLMHRWMLGYGYLTPQPRVPLAGLVKLDGAPLLRGMLILTPIDNPNAPPVTVYITNANTDPMGSFAVAKEQGPIAGRYRVEVRQDAVRWLSNSRDPVMLKMTAKARENSLTEADRAEWAAYVRKRDQSPSIEGQRVYRRQRPADKNDYVVEIKNGANQLAIEVFSH